MKKTKWNNLKIGDKVQLSNSRPIYGCGFREHPFIPSGTTGIIGAIKVPFVTGKNGFFACVDFPWNAPLVNNKNQELILDNSHHKNYRRVSVIAEDLV